MIRNMSPRKWVATFLLSTLLFSQIVAAATVTLATAPLANSTTTAVRPNIMYMLDNSGSMGWEYLPDYVNDNMCWSGTSDSNSRTSCPSSYSSLGSTGGGVTVPFAAYDFNRIYYNPNIRYKPPLKADGTSYSIATPTAAWTDGFAASGSVNLTTSYPHQVWCTASGVATPSPSYNAATGVVTLSGGTAPDTWECKENTDTSVSPYLYPIGVYTTAKSYSGPPYYYNMAPLVYCTAGSTPSDANCQYTSDATHTVPYDYLWCGSYSTSTHAFSSCADLYDPRAASSHIIPNYLGGMVAASGTTTRATATITVTGNYTAGFSINGLYVNGTNIISGSVAGAGTATATATAIKNAINANTATTGYSATSSSASITITAPNACVAAGNCASYNGYAVTVSGPAGTAGSKATGTITVNSTAGATVIQDITVGGTSILNSKPINFTDGTATSSVATDIATRINPVNHTVSVAGNVITLTNNTAGTSGNGALVVSAAATGASSPQSTLAISSVSSGTYDITVKAGSNSTCSSSTVTLASITGYGATTSGACGGSSNSRKRANNMLDALYAVNAGTATATAGWSDSDPSPPPPATNNCIGSITYTAPVGPTYSNYYLCLDDTPNITWSSNRFSVGQSAANPQSTTVVGMSGGADGSGTIQFTLGSFAGGVDAASAHRVNVGKFTQVKITPAVTSYPKALERTDCAGATCTYNEELQNFANWFAYYRSRMLMMKTASTFAFDALDGKYRVGFDRLSNYGGTTVQQGVAQFINNGEVANQRSTWWSNLTGATTSGSTPLRGELAKLGRYYAGKLTSTDPMLYSCQQNYTLLVTDGYWNTNSYVDLKQVDGTTQIGNQDNVLTTDPRPFYDGAQPNTTCTDSGYSSCGTLADVAAYYYKTDLRSAALGNASSGATGADVSANNVFTSGDDKNTAQHMTLYTLGLGVPGTLHYSTTYASDLTGDFAEIRSGAKNWPAAKQDDPTAIDDLWHAAVNGRGKYFSAADPTEVSNGLIDALSSITARVGSAAAAAVSNLTPVAGDNYAYVASYETVSWVGDLQARTIDLGTGQVSSGVDSSGNSTCGVSGSGCPWSAQALLDAKTWSTRNIYIKPSSGSTLRTFVPVNLTATELNYFDPSSLSQYAGLVASYSGSLTKSNVVNYLSGDRSMEINNSLGNPPLWRSRSHVLGDIVNTTPTYIRAPAFAYSDAGYSTYRSANASRTGMVYVSANDGMMHAFNADTGQEAWAYIPTALMPSLKALADENYSHQFFADGPITVNDVYFSSDSSWHTVLVGGLAGGGKSYYALDVTDPANPKYLWEVSSADTGFENLGYTFSKPSMNKLPNGQWVVMFASGYNNADGKGYLYAVNPETGAIKSGFPLSTGSGTAGSPSNLGKISAWVDSPNINNTAQFVYAGDLNGDVWRFDLNPSAAGHSGVSVFKLAHLEKAGVAQPVSTRIEMTTVNTSTSTYHVIYVATGQYLGIPDLSNTDVQSVYAIKDAMSSTTTLFPDTTHAATFSERTFTNTTATSGAFIGSQVRQLSGSDCSTFSWDSKNGWYANFPDTGERNNVDMLLTLGTLEIATNVPESSVCTSGGYSWINFMDYKTGCAINAEATNVYEVANWGGLKFTSALIVGISTIKLGDTIINDVRTSDNQDAPVSPPIAGSSFAGKRDFWREFEQY